ncbi:MAG: branched-chain amino acid aminotransferase [Oscillospiraceae bacterium]|nr:branched-chain amino acid aminotransferase [Oscillospiraceae bacterium]
MNMNISITKTTTPKPKPDINNLGFGQYFSDHMFTMDYIDGKWQNAQIVPYQNISMDPATMALHYGQLIFEGMKAYKTADGSIFLFRPRKNFERVNVSNERLAMPPVDEDFCLEALCELIKLDADWIPDKPGTSLYIRPFMFATDPFLGVRPSQTYKFMIILSPVGAYYSEGLNPVKIYAEDEFVRAVRGGVGFTKTAGNYAASLKAQTEAHDKGYSQVLWLDGIERKYIEEVGSMNVFFKIGDEVITPELSGSILSGITRMSVIELLQKWGVKVTERKLSIDEVMAAAENGTLKESWGTGTAAVISPIGELNFKGNAQVINNNEIGELTSKLYDTITGIQTHKIADDMGWTFKV